MAAFELAPDERIISAHDVTLVERGTKIAAMIHLTTHRLVVTPGAGLRPAWNWALNPFNWLFGSLHRKKQPRIYHQMRRDAFASIEREDGDLIVFHDSGDGYAHVSFAITPDVFSFTPESFEVWEQRITEWAPQR